MKSFCVPVAFVVLCFSIISQCFPVEDEGEATLYLQKFGYLEESIGYRSGANQSRDTLSGVIKDFQRFAGLNQTGSKRTVSQLTYRISKYPTRIKDKVKIDNEVSRVFKIWSDVTKLGFREKKRGRVNTDIRFETREHGDPVLFDDRGETLAHAFFPQFGGDAHFDDEEKWTIDERIGSRDDTFTGEVDIPITVSEPDTSDAPDLCQDAAIDTATRTKDGRTYVFKGDFYWNVLSNGIADGYPRRISDDWDGLPGNLDASLTWSNGKTFFFRGGLYWRFTNREMDSGYPKLLSVGFKGIPDRLDAALYWYVNGKTYFFKGDKYWRYDSNSEPRVNDTYPRPISNWNGLPDSVDAAFKWEKNWTYFFKGDEYYRMSGTRFQVDSLNPPYPRSTSEWWFGCKSISQKTASTGNPTDSTEATSSSTVGNQGSRDDTFTGEEDIPPTGPEPDTSDAPDLCQDAAIDTITRTQNGSTYVFKGDFYWKVLSEGIADGYPRRISDDWDGLPGNLDASLTWSNGKTFFFQGGRYWRFTNREMDSGYPKLLNVGFEGIPDKLDAAFVWSGNGKTYFFKGDKYWRFDSKSDSPVSDKYLRPISNKWNGMADSIDAAFQWENSKTYIFKGDEYYRMSDTNFQVDFVNPPYPRSTSEWWFGCKSIS